MSTHTLGNLVRIVRTDGSEILLRNITEIHFGFEGSSRTAFESDVHSTGRVIETGEIREFEATPETTLASGFEKRFKLLPA